MACTISLVLPLKITFIYKTPNKYPSNDLNMRRLCFKINHIPWFSASFAGSASEFETPLSLCF